MVRVKRVKRKKPQVPRFTHTDAVNHPQRIAVRRRTAAAMLDCSVRKLKDLEQAGLLTPIRLGTKRKAEISYRMAELEALVRGV
jgi:hypothetical protein